MQIYFNHKIFTIKTLSDIKNDDLAYSELIDFMIKWLNGDQTFIFKTSGSTGVRKNITITRYQIESSVFATKKAIGLESNDKVLICLNPTYIATIMMAARCLILDLDLYITPAKSNPFKEIDQNVKIDFASFVPLQIDAILKNKESHRLQDIRNILIGGAPLSIGLINQLSKINTHIYQTYGMTETVSHIALMKLQNELCFNALEGISIKQDERNCLAIKGVVTHNQWVQTNDIVELIDDKKFKWLGRVDNVINSGGIKVFPEELESIVQEVLSQHNFNNSYFFYGEKDGHLGVKIGLVFEKNMPNHTLLELVKNRIKTRLSKYHIPKKISHVDKFSRTDSGKIKRIATINLLN